MTVLVGFLAGKGGRAALDLGAQIARSSGERLVSVTVVPTPALGRLDAEHAARADAFGQRAVHESSGYLGISHPDLDHESVFVTGTSVSTALIRAAEQHTAEIMVLGSSPDGRFGRIVVGSTADKLLHSSPVPVALAPRGYHPRPAARVSRVTCCMSGDDLSRVVLRRTAELTERVGARLRLATFGVRGRTMYPPEVGVGIEDEVLLAWTQQAQQIQQRELDVLAAEGLLPEGTEAMVSGGDGWASALDGLIWTDEELLVLGSSAAGPLARVFIGSHATKIVRHSPVPCVVVPAASVSAA